MQKPVEFAAFEHQKENILPIKSGRDPTVLAKIYDQQQSEYKMTKSLEKTADDYENLIKNSDEDEDPLAIHHEYIQWHIQNHPSDIGELKDKSTIYK
jgi:hypothetical protein